MKKRTSIIVAGCAAAVLTIGGVSVYAAGQLAKAAAITEEEAYHFALADADVNAEDAAFLHAEYEIEGGTPVYDVEFVADGIEYDYDIKAEDGTVLKKEADPVRRTENDSPNEPAASVEIPTDTAVGTAVDAPADVPVKATPTAEQNAPTLAEEEAVAIALKAAGKSESEVVFTEIKREHDDGREVYEIEFTVPGEAEYDYEIDAATGEILEHSTEKLVKPGIELVPEAQPATDPAATPALEITVEDAKRIALNHAGKSADEVVFEKAKREKDDGSWIYEVEFFVEGVSEYEYEIDAVTGEILEEDVEAWDGDD
ncbi:MAG: PepSY domain-containing protein [Oscillospiraceae bacterium]|nr:PepSY domain-containing protein [Oscillospiraceae bacterium]